MMDIRAFLIIDRLHAIRTLKGQPDESVTHPLIRLRLAGITDGSPAGYSGDGGGGQSGGVRMTRTPSAKTPKLPKPRLTAQEWQSADTMPRFWQEPFLICGCRSSGSFLG